MLDQFIFKNNYIYILNINVYTIDDTVTLNSLVSLRFIAEDGTRKPLHLIDRVASNWRILGDALNVEGYDIANIGKNNSTVQDCCRDVVSHWLNGTEPKTWRRLMEALVYAKFGREADVLEVVLQSPNGNYNYKL